MNSPNENKGPGGLKPRSGNVPHAENLSPEDKALADEIRKLAESGEANLALVSVQTQLRLAKAVEDLRDGLFDFVELAEMIAAHLGVDIGEDEEKPKEDGAPDAP